MTLTIDPGARVLRGLAVPFGEPAFVLERGDIVAEMFDELSVPISKLPIGAPLLIGHNQNAPIGKITAANIRAGQGIFIEARIAVSEAELDGLHARFREGLLTGLSVGFFPSGPQVHGRAQSAGLPPTLLRRGVTIRETSLVQWPAYDSAGLQSLSLRTAASEEALAMAEEVAEEVHIQSEIADLRKWSKAESNWKTAQILKAIAKEQQARANWTRMGVYS